MDPGIIAEVRGIATIAALIVGHQVRRFLVVGKPDSEAQHALY
jgi:hypothetical protein